MCGIAGCISFNPNYSHVNILNYLDRSSQSMQSRGPDSAGTWLNETKNAGFAHRRLSILDTSDLASQPMKDPNTGNTIVYNGEIYNYTSLKTDLIRKGISFRTNSDTEVLLKLYEVYKEEMLPMLRGMFTFAIWDNKLQELFIARDHFGIKPLYFYEDENKFQFASQVKAILAGKDCRTEVEPAGLVGFYLWGHVPEPFTLYKNILSIQPGSWMRIRLDRSRQQSYFFNIREEANNIFESTLDEYDSLCSDHSAVISSSINAHLTSHVPVGIFLSSGIDSSIIAATTSRIYKESKFNDDPDKSWVKNVQSLTTLTLGFQEYKGTDDDEVPLAEKIANQINSNQITGRISQSDYLENSSHLFNSMDQPSIDGANTFFVSKLAKSHGLKVALSGLGADEFFGGYSTFSRVPRVVNLLSLANKSSILRRGLLFISNGVLRKITPPKFSSILEYSDDIESSYLLNRCLYMPWELPQFLDSAIVKEGWEKLQTIDQLKSFSGGINDDFLKVSLLETSFYMKNQLLRDSDWASMAHSLELRVPFVDIEIFKHVCAQRSKQQKITKSQFFESMGNDLPSEIGKRSKTGFSIPVSKWQKLASISPELKLNNSSRAWASEVIKNFHI